MKENNNNLLIAKLGENILRKKAKKVKNIHSKKIKQLIKKMLICVDENKGVGLAAPQVFKSLQILVISSKPNERYPFAPYMKPTIMINPKIINTSKKQEKDWEGCLSIPGIRAQVPRYKKIKIKFTTSKGKRKTMVLKNFIARVFQHEYDHLIGLVYLDRVENTTDIISEDIYIKKLNIK